MNTEAITQTYIEINPKVMLGKRVIKGTRITVEMILEKLSTGESFDEIFAEHPRLEREHILAVLPFEKDNIKLL